MDIIELVKLNAMDFHQLKRTSLSNRKSLVNTKQETVLPTKPASFQNFFDCLPQYLKANDLKEFVNSMLEARNSNKPILFMMGAHPIKVGLSPWITQAIQQKWITALAMNGACMVHDFELAYAGTTSEDVAESLIDGSFGMTLETGQMLNEWICKGAECDKGLGNTIGEHIANSEFPYKKSSLFACAYQNFIPISVHVALGTDVIHHHPEASGEAIGKSSMIDFHSLCETVSHLGDGGIVMNVGSNVILPEVFLKALTVARNIKGPIHNFTTANFDMIQHYRPNTNVVQRPTLGGGKGYSFTGHHEIMLPLLFQALFEHSS